ncbi:MAG: BTAD domain-containing putative transcriptional regulator [Actinomycetota bacterium]
MSENLVEVHLLGPLQIIGAAGDRVRLAPRPSQIAALLALADGAVVGVDELITELWGDDPPSTARNSVQTFVSDLRRALGPHARDTVRFVDGGYQLDPERSTTDLHRFDRLIRAAADAADPSARSALLSDALGLWRGTPDADLPDHGRLAAAMVDVHERRLAALEQLAELAIDGGRSGEQLGVLREIVSQEPYREQAVGLLARALYAEDRQSEALGVLSALRDRLRDDLGLHPSRAIDQLETSILTQDRSLDRTEPDPHSHWHSQRRASTLPSGIVTLLFSDIEGSTPLWEADADRMGEALERHNEIFGREVERAGGTIVKSDGDSLLVAFTNASQAVGCAVEVQRRLADVPWETSGPIRVRIGVHSSELEPAGTDYLGPAVNLAARVMHAGHGGQILVTGTVANLIRRGSVADASVRRLGRFELRGIEEPVELHQVQADGLGSQFPPLLAVRADLSLPNPTSTFVGRSEEIVELESIVASNRLVTILGEGGLGKTRLAIEVGRRLAADTASVWFADLAPRADRAAAVAEICRTVGLTEVSGDPLDALRMRIGHDRALLVIDNCEHVVETVHQLTRVLLEDCQGLRVLATSRVPLNLDGERRYPLRPMPIDGDARSLLELRAEEVGHLDPIPAPEANALCEYLDGIPLAIELAASWLRVLQPTDLIQRLRADGSLMDDGQTHAKTMAQTIDWSLGRLADEDATAFDSLCEFPGGIALEQAEELLGPGAPSTLGRLLDASLIRTTRDPGRRRYRLLEPLRAVGLSRTTGRGDRPVHRRAQAEVMRTLMSSVGEGLPSPEEVLWRGRLEDELPNFAAAMAWAAETDVELAIGLCAPLAPLVSFVPADAARLAIPVTSGTAWRANQDGLAVAALGLFAIGYLDANPAAADLLPVVDEELDARGADVAPSVLIHLATIQTVMNDPLGAIDLYREASERARATGEVVTLAEALMLEGAWQWFTQSAMDHDRIRECSELADALGGPSLISLCEVVNGFASVANEPERARRHFQRALAVDAPTGYGPGVAEFMLGLLHAQRGEADDALELARASLRRFMAAGLQIEVGMALGGLTATLLALDHRAAARQTAEILAKHYPPIAAMGSFAVQIERAREATGGHVEPPGRRDQALTETLATIDRIAADGSD